MSAPSFEFFPPRAQKDLQPLTQRAKQLVDAAAPVSFSVTCGAGGSAAEGTMETVRAVQAAVSVPVVPHIACYGRTRAQISSWLRDAVATDCRTVLAIRGDQPADASCDELPHGVSLVRFIAETQPELAIEVACYPEKHPESASSAADMDYLALKEQAGAKTAVSQLFFDAEVFLRFRDRCLAAGIGLKLVPGIMPVHSLAAVQRMAERCGSAVPPSLAERLQDMDDGGEQQRAVGAEIMAGEIGRLLNEGVERVHFYCLNRLQPSLAICRQLDWG